MEIRQLILSISALSSIIFANEEGLHRQKRFLIFYNGGTFKLVLGIAIPVKLAKYQSMALGWNLQYQYSLPTNITQLNPQSYPPVVKRSVDEEYIKEERISDRAIFYAGIEKILEQEGLNGRECLLRSICENAMESTYHDANGLYGQLIHILLTPDYGEGDVNPDLDQSYFEAQRAGIYGVECESLYNECDIPDGLLSLITNVESYFG